MGTRVNTKFVGAALLFASLPLIGVAQTVTLDFDTDKDSSTIGNGQIIDTEYGENGTGVEIWAVNVGGGPDIAAVYSSAPNNGSDPDLETNEFGAWSGGNASNTQAGNLLIIQENAEGCGASFCNDPDDEGSRPAGSLYFDFNQAITSTSFDLIDVERPENTGANLSLLDSDRNVIAGSTITFDSLSASNGATWGDNFYNSISTIFFDTLQLTQEVFGLKFDLGGSGALNNVTASYHSVPEIDAASGSIALALLAGFIALMRERRKSLGQSLAA